MADFPENRVELFAKCPVSTLPESKKHLEAMLQGVLVFIYQPQMIFSAISVAITPSGLPVYFDSVRIRLFSPFETVRQISAALFTGFVIYILSKLQAVSDRPRFFLRFRNLSSAFLCFR